MALLVGCSDDGGSAAAPTTVASTGCDTFPVTTAAPLAPALVPGTGEVAITMRVDESVDPFELGDIAGRVTDALVLGDPATEGMAVTFDETASLILVYAPREVADHVAEALLAVADAEPAITEVDGVRCG